MSNSPPIHQDILTKDKIDHAGAILAKESISQAPKGTSILQSGKDTSIPTFSMIRANILRSVVPDFQKSIQTREAEKHARPFRLTDVPAERFANAVRVNNSGENINKNRAKSGYEAVDEHGTQKRKKSIMYEDTNYIGIANLQIYAFFGLTAASGLGSVLILASLKKMPQLIFGLPFALFSGWQMYGYYLSTRAAAEQATKIQYLRMVQGGIEDDPDRQSKFVKKPEKMLANSKDQQQQEQDGEENATTSATKPDRIESGKAEVVHAEKEVKKSKLEVEDEATKKPVLSEEEQFAKLRSSMSIPTSR